MAPTIQEHLVWVPLDISNYVPIMLLFFFENKYFSYFFFHFQWLERFSYGKLWPTLLIKCKAGFTRLEEYFNMLIILKNSRILVSSGNSLVFTPYINALKIIIFLSI